MPIIKAGSATKPTNHPDVPVFPLFPATGDIQQVQLWDEESYRLWTPRYKYYQLKIEESKPDSIYGEPTDIESGGEVYADIPTMVYAYVHWDSSNKVLSKFGITKERDVVFEFSVFILQNLVEEHPPYGLSPKRGDVVVVDRTEYVIEEVKRGQPWYGNVQFPIHIYCPATLRKASNITDDRADETVNAGPEHPTAVGVDTPQEPEDLFTDPTQDDSPQDMFDY